MSYDDGSASDTVGTDGEYDGKRDDTSDEYQKERMIM